MSGILSIAKTGLGAQQTLASNTANNLANASTDGYQSTRVLLGDLPYQKIRQPGGTTASGNEFPEGLLLGTGVRVLGTTRDLRPGSPSETKAPYDMFINGPGYFQVLQDDGTPAYKRDGHFAKSSTGALTDLQGRQLIEPIMIPNNATNVTIGRDGTVAVTTPGSTTPSIVGTIQLAQFMSAGGLEPIGDNLYLETPASGSPTIGAPGQDGLGQITQGSVEGSNVNVVEELVNLIQGQRNYEINAKAIETGDGMLKFATQVL